MPAYEYQCSACSHHFEQRQKMSDAPVAVCPACGGSVKRLISGGAGAITKGGGYSVSDAGAACGFGGGCCAPGGSCCSGPGCGE